MREREPRTNPNARVESATLHAIVAATRPARAIDPRTAARAGTAPRAAASSSANRSRFRRTPGGGSAQQAGAGEQRGEEAGLPGDHREERAGKRERARHAASRCTIARIVAANSPYVRATARAPACTAASRAAARAAAWTADRATGACRPRDSSPESRASGSRAARGNAMHRARARRATPRSRSAKSGDSGSGAPWCDRTTRSE